MARGKKTIEVAVIAPSVSAIKGMTPELEAKFRKLSVEPTQRYFEAPGFEPLIAEADQWKALPPLETVNGLWNRVVAYHNGEEFKFQTFRNAILDEDEGIKIMLFRAKETFRAGNGKLVKEGTEKFVAMQG